MKMLSTLAVAASALAMALPASANAAELVVNVAGAQAFGDLGDPSNTLRTFNIGAGSTITAVAYNVSITAFGASYLSESTLSFTDSAQAEGVFLSPGFANTAPGTATFTSSANLVDLGLDFAVGSDGILRLEWFEGFTDDELPDSVWNSGTVTFTYTPGAGAVPEPATWAMMIGGFGLAGGMMRRRQKVSVAYAA